MGRHRDYSGGKFKHKHVTGETDPQKIKDQLDAIEAAERAERDRILRERNDRGSSEIGRIVGWAAAALVVLAVIVICGGDINNWASGR